VSLTSPAIVLATRPMGEADLYVVLLTPGAGKVRCAARHARRSRKRFPGGLPGGAMGEAQLHRSRHPDGLWRLDDFRSLLDLTDLGRDLERFAYVAYLCELSDALLQEPEPDPRCFAALSEALEATVRAPPHPAVLRRFEVRILDALGLFPVLDACCVCGASGASATTASVAVDLERGGTLCDDHCGAAERIAREVVELASVLSCTEAVGSAIEALDRASTEHRRALRDLTASVVRPQLRHGLRSMAFFTQLTGSPVRP